ncbi:hypothetical protein WICMUC_002368 [Wickerhamomyces mucosus]|uniref:Uncharacterized protein n=1 Tax=Wickerhamomyces mucosus TaxID=1378264 RepID=A0A9P8TF47_9ASCO|nr:hypothetical protein WICMUC_002368 [Wickerhamomyces mucosus]
MASAKGKIPTLALNSSFKTVKSSKKTESGVLNFQTLIEPSSDPDTNSSVSGIYLTQVISPVCPFNVEYTPLPDSVSGFHNAIVLPAPNATILLELWISATYGCLFAPINIASVSLMVSGFPL